MNGRTDGRTGGQTGRHKYGQMDEYIDGVFIVRHTIEKINKYIPGMDRVSVCMCVRVYDCFK